MSHAQFYSQQVTLVLDIMKRKIIVHDKRNLDRFEISIEYASYVKQMRGYLYRICECEVSGVFSDDKWKVYCSSEWLYGESLQRGYLFVSAHLSRIFNCMISTKRAQYTGYFQTTFAGFFDLQFKFEKLSIDLKNIQSEMLKQVCGNLQLVEHLTIQSLPSSIPIFSTWPMRISIRDASWVTLTTLLTSTSFRIELEDSQLEYKDLEEILENWKTAGRFQNLEYLKISYKKIDVEADETDEIIQTNDGEKKAMISWKTSCFEMKVEKK
ncbi:hypothetical protein CRE_05156 [Caenorhabditis remanei]|uniref:Sdz-33 F-box domain-containing protein n=1 Tax=Caenorhabditis remanei TaxID=31234 RepID=E3N6D1_CAERE|nr:hypothetical protein CRE_05156 [Caenorhabditis remanei]